MKTINDEFELLTSFMQCIAAQFGDKCEVVLHDFSRDYDSTIVAIENGQVTGREVGDCATNLGFEFLRDTNTEGDRYNYITHIKDGKVLRSSTTNIKNDNGEVIGSICINFDITDFIAAGTAIKGITMQDSKQEVKEVFSKNVNELLDYFLQECQEEVGKTVPFMTKEDKIKAVEFLDKKGAFLITKSGNKVCDFLKISKFTLYNYLDEIRSK